MRIDYLLVLVAVFAISCNRDNESCNDFITHEDITLTEYLDPDPTNLKDRTFAIKANIDRQDDLYLSYDWKINNQSYTGSHLELSGNGIREGELTISNAGCSITQNVLFDFDKPAGILGCQVWQDSRTDEGGITNIYDPTDIPMENVVVELIDGQSLAVIQRDTTNALGRYFFVGVPSGEYFIKIHKPNYDNSYMFLPPNIGGEDYDCDVVTADGLSEIVVLEDWEERINIGAGFRRCYIQDITCDISQPCFGRVSTDDIDIIFINDGIPDANGDKTVIATAEIPHAHESSIGIEYTWYVDGQMYTGKSVTIKGRGHQKAVLAFSKGGCSISRDLTINF